MAALTLDEAVAALEGLGALAPSRAGRVVLSRDGPVATLRLDNPDARNAVTIGMMGELARSVRALCSADVVAVRLEACGDRAFCSGGQVDELVGALDRPEAARAMCGAMGAVLDAFRAAAFVSIAVVDAPAVGGGAELVTACDVALVGAAGSLHFAQAGLGIPTGWGGVRRLVERLGPARALEVALSDARYDGPAAERLGLATFAPGGAAAEADARVAALLRLPAVAVRATKRQVVAALTGDRAEDAAAFASAWGGPAHREAIARRRRR